MIKKKVLGYKVRHAKTNLYLSSISNKKWTKIGKTWPRKGDVVRAINIGIKSFPKWKNFIHKDKEDIFEDIANWEVVELTEELTYPVLFLIDKIKTD